jgi:hypothetical protein
MQTTKTNLSHSFSEFSAQSKNADFFTIDLEMTGLYRSNQPRGSVLDTTEEKYHSLRAGATDYTILQLGICIATHHPETNSYTYTPFNLYTWPSKFNGSSLSPLGFGSPIHGGGSLNNPGLLHMDTEAIEYNREHGMDFTKWIHQGVPYWRNHQVKEIEEYYQKAIDFEAKYQQFDLYNDTFVSKMNKADSLRADGWRMDLFEQFGQLKEQIGAQFGFNVDEDVHSEQNPKFTPQQPLNNSNSATSTSLDSQEPDWVNKIPVIPYINQEQFENGPICFELTKMPNSPSIQTVFRNHIESQYPRDHSYIIRVDFKPIEGMDRFCQPIVRIYTPQQHIKRLNSTTMGLKEELTNTLGANMFWNVLKSAKKPIVVHNGMFDLLFCFSHFEGELPQNFNTFRARLNKNFPHIFDTKFIYNHPINQGLIRQGVVPFTNSTSLGSLFEILEHRVRKEGDFGGDNDEKSVKKVEKSEEKVTDANSSTETATGSTLTSDGTLNADFQPTLEIKEKNDNLSEKHDKTKFIPPNPPPLTFLHQHGSNYLPDPDNDNRHYHEAAYDAFATAVVFAKLRNIISQFHNFAKNNLSPQEINYNNSQTATLLKQFNFNKLQDSLYDDDATPTGSEPTPLTRSSIKRIEKSPTPQRSIFNTNEDFFGSLFRGQIFDMKSFSHYNLRLPLPPSASLVDTIYTDPLTMDNLIHEDGDGVGLYEDEKNGEIVNLKKELEIIQKKTLKYSTLYDFKHNLYHPYDKSNLFVLINTAEELWFQQKRLGLVAEEEKIIDDKKQSNQSNQQQKNRQFAPNNKPRADHFHKIFSWPSLYHRRVARGEILPLERNVDAGSEGSEGSEESGDENNENNKHKSKTGNIDITSNSNEKKHHINPQKIVPTTSLQLPPNLHHTEFDIRSVMGHIFTIQCTPPVSQDEMLWLLRKNANKFYPKRKDGDKNEKNENNQKGHTGHLPVEINVEDWNIIPYHIYMAQRELDYMGKGVGKNLIQFDFFNQNNSNLDNNNNLNNNSGENKHPKFQSFFTFLKQIKTLQDELFKQYAHHNGVHIEPIKVENDINNDINNIKSFLTNNIDQNNSQNNNSQNNNNNNPQHDHQPEIILNNTELTLDNLQAIHKATTTHSLLSPAQIKRQYTQQLELQAQHNYQHSMRDYRQNVKKYAESNPQKSEYMSTVSNLFSSTLSTAGNFYTKNKPFLLGTVAGLTTGVLAMTGIYTNSMAFIHKKAISDLPYSSSPYFTQYNASSERIYNDNREQELQIGKNRHELRKQITTHKLKSSHFDHKRALEMKKSIKDSKHAQQRAAGMAPSRNNR